jgi:hypothetical protein
MEVLPAQLRGCGLRGCPPSTAWWRGSAPCNKCAPGAPIGGQGGRHHGEEVAARRRTRAVRCSLPTPACPRRRLSTPASSTGRAMVAAAVRPHTIAHGCIGSAPAHGLSFDAHHLRRHRRGVHEKCVGCQTWWRPAQEDYHDGAL